MAYFETEFSLLNIVFNDVKDKRIILSDNGKMFTSESLVEGKWSCIGKATSYDRAMFLLFPLRKRKAYQELEKPNQVKAEKLDVSKWIVRGPIKEDNKL